MCNSLYVFVSMCSTVGGSYVFNCVNILVRYVYSANIEQILSYQWLWNKVVKQIGLHKFSLILTKQLTKPLCLCLPAIFI